MKISEQKIKEFQDIYEEYFGECIDKEKAHEFGENLARLIKLIYKPIQKEAKK